jgi:hypothetical protein
MNFVVRSFLFYFANFQKTKINTHARTQMLFSHGINHWKSVLVLHYLTNCLTVEDTMP